MNFADFKSLCEQRHSVRYFDTEKPVTTRDIEDLLSVATLAPNVQNTQPWHFHVITNADMRAKLMETSCYGNFVAGAGAFIVVTCKKDDKPKNEQLLWNPKELEYSCVSAMQNIILGATAKGLGTCWVSMFHGSGHDLLKLKPNEVVVGGMLIGHMRDDEAEKALPRERKKNADVYTLYA